MGENQNGDGKKWYLNIKNYSWDFLKDEAMVAYGIEALRPD
ncbi:MAG: hypothetical protein OIN88_00285 [Candidatus Methanoperedens sp.]|nr:hypothetical protein [Candidatus Methanoperedens sp.]MCZ7360828.1 hypothetical protein [Candidatus Methanoperedens sp.]HLB72333.1 hypothetical protein [Candidatus Methanoperedens sp.]